jgi:hypothetical protein
MNVALIAHSQSSERILACGESCWVEKAGVARSLVRAMQAGVGFGRRSRS